MLANYAVEYGAAHRQHPAPPPEVYYTDDPLACEAFVEEALDRGLSLREIRHQGVALPQSEFDRIVKVAARSLVAKRICACLGLKPDEERHRFGFAT